MLHDDFITQLLNMEDSPVKVDNIETDLTEKVKYVHISTKPVPAFCEKCGSRMHSKGHDIRKPVHSMLQDGFKLVLVYKQRRWKCTNPGLHLPMSDEVYLYGRCRWVILKNRDTLTCQIPQKPDRHFRYFMDIYDYEEKFRKTDPQLMLMRDLKEEYIQFNSRNSGNRDNAEKELPLLIDKYLSSGVDEFADIARSLKKYYEPILNSFIMLERTGSRGPYYSRLSNGPMEGLNRKPKDMKRICRGFDNFEHLRNRFLFAERKNAPVLASPRSISQVRDDSFTGAKRGSYTKSKNTLFKDSEPEA